MDINQIRLDRTLSDFLDRDHLRRDLLWKDPGRIIGPWRLYCTIRMLVVLDGGGFGLQDFGLEEFLSSFQTNPAPGVRFHVTRAHQASDPDADIENFDFAAHDLGQYDVIWLFGVSGFGGLPAADLRALSEYMDGGGGVFATGDHASLGVRMCGAVPRVRSMRKWHWPNPGPNGEPVAPSGSGPDRFDTVWDDGMGAPTFDDQSDDIPQKLRVRMYHTPHHFLWHRSWRYPHPVLCGPNGVIDILPDHAHEGECYVPSDLSAVITHDGYACTEYPADSSGTRIRPEIIAWSDNQSGIVEKGALNDHRFGAIGVLDGHRADVGRVLVDATWHHFFNINLQGELGNPDPVKSVGFYASAAGQQALARIKTYYRNIGVWLARASTQRCIATRAWWWVRWHHRVQMDLAHLHLPFDKIEPSEFLRIGRIARDVLGKFAPQCQTLGWTLIFFDPAIRAKLLWPVIPAGPLLPELPEELTQKLTSDPLSETAALAALDGAVGAMIYRLAQDFPRPEDTDRAEKTWDRTFDRLHKAARAGIAAGEAMTEAAAANGRAAQEILSGLKG